MTTRGVSVLAVGLVAFLVLGGGASAVGASPGQPEALAQGPMQAAFLQAPLSFEVNRGQTAAQVKYLSRGLGRTLFLTPSEAVLVLQRDQQTRRDPWTPPVQPTVLRLRLVGANPAPRVEGLEPLPGKANYFIGNDPTKWRANIPTYTKVKYQSVYPGVDLVYYGTNQRQLEYDFVVAPGANPKAIRLAFTGMDRLTLDAQGNLILHTAGREVLQHAPRVYQEINGARQAVAGGYVLHGKDQVGFRVARYDATRPLVIDPVLSYATYLGGSGDDTGLAIAVDAAGNAYVTGSTLSANFPLQQAYQPGFGGGSLAGSHDAFVTKLDPSQVGATSLVYSTYFGGTTGDDQGTGIAVGSGRVYVTGTTFSTDFSTVNAYQTGLGGSAGTSDVFVAVFDEAGSPLTLTLHYATYLGNSDADEGLAIAVDSLGNAYVTGRTFSTSFPTKNAFQSSSGSPGTAFDAFVAMFDPSQVGAASLVYSTYLGGLAFDQGLGIAVDGAGNAYVTGSTRSTNFPLTAGAYQSALGGGQDAIVAKIAPPTGGGPASLVYSTYLGGGGSDSGQGIAVDSSGNAYVTGFTNSTTFPTTPATAYQAVPGGSLDAFVAKLNPTLSGAASLVYSTYLGGTSGDQAVGIAVDAAGNAYVSGFTSSIDFPTANALTGCGTGVNVGTGGDIFVAKLNPTLSGAASLLYSTFLGGGSAEFGGGIAVDGFGSAYVTASTTSTNFPLTAGAYQSVLGGGQDAIMAKLGVVSPTFCVTVSLAGTGTVTSSPAVIACPGTCEASFPSGGVSLTANATGGSAFGGWGVDCITAGMALTCTLATNANHSVTATFNAPVPPFTVTVSLAGTGTGTVTSNPPGLICTSGSCGQSFTTPVTLTATPTGGSTFVGWSGGCSGSGTCSVSSTQSVTATFNPPPIPLVVSIGGTGAGTVTSSPAGITCLGVCSATFTSGTPVTLTAAPTGGATFSWGGDCATFNPALTCNLTMDVSKSVTATFSVVGGDGASSCNMVGHVHGNQNYKATISGKKVNVHVEVDGDCDYDKKTNKVFLHHAMVHVVVGGGPPLINAKQNSNGKRDDVKSVTLSPGPPPATGTPTAIVEGVYNAIPFKVTLTDGGKRDKDDDHDKCGKGGDDKRDKGGDDKWSKDDGGKRDKDDDHDKCGKGGDDGKGNKDDTIVVMTPVLPAPITGSAPHDDVHIDFK